MQWSRIKSQQSQPTPIPKVAAGKTSTLDILSTIQLGTPTTDSWSTMQLQGPMLKIQPTIQEETIVVDLQFTNRRQQYTCVHPPEITSVVDCHPLFKRPVVHHQKEEG